MLSLNYFLIMCQHLLCHHWLGVLGHSQIPSFDNFMHNTKGTIKFKRIKNIYETNNNGGNPLSIALVKSSLI